MRREWRKNCMPKNFFHAFHLELDKAWRGLRNDLDTVGAVKTRDDSLPEFLLAVLGAADWLQHVVELAHAAGHHTVCIACTAHYADKVVVICRRNVMQTSLGAHPKPAHMHTDILGSCNKNEYLCLLKLNSCGKH